MSRDLTWYHQAWPPWAPMCSRRAHFAAKHIWPYSLVQLNMFSGKMRTRIGRSPWRCWPTGSIKNRFYLFFTSVKYYVFTSAWSTRRAKDMWCKSQRKETFKQNKVFRSRSLTVCDTFVLFCFYFGLIDNGEQKSCNVKVKKERKL